MASIRPFESETDAGPLDRADLRAEALERPEQALDLVRRRP
jgi:hypothetical protein